MTETLESNLGQSAGELPKPDSVQPKQATHGPLKQFHVTGAVSYPKPVHSPMSVQSTLTSAVWTPNGHHAVDVLDIIFA